MLFDKDKHKKAAKDIGIDEGAVDFVYGQLKTRPKVFREYVRQRWEEKIGERILRMMGIRSPAWSNWKAKNGLYQRQIILDYLRKFSDRKDLIRAFKLIQSIERLAQHSYLRDNDPERLFAMLRNEEETADTVILDYLWKHLDEFK